MPDAVIEPVLCSCGTLLPPVEVKDPFSGEVRLFQAWPVKGCPVCQERARKAASTNPSPCNGRGAGVRVRTKKHFGLYEYPD